MPTLTDLAPGPSRREGERASALRFGDRRVQALFSVLVLFSLQARAFMRALLAQLLGLDPTHYPQGVMSAMLPSNLPTCFSCVVISLWNTDSVQ
jgi:hypothetical protein